MNTFFIKTMGCKSNQLEGGLIEENLVKNGFKKAQRISDADIFILNSCTVTHKSDNEAFQIIKKAKHDNPDIKIILTGCIAQTEKEKLLENPDLDIVLGNDEKLEISKYLTEATGKRKGEREEFCVGEISNLNSFHSVLLHDTQKTRASLKIQDGCDNRCSYCIIPFARGKNRSADLDFILEQIKIYEDAGFKEIVLTGIHIGQWQRGETGNRKQGADLLYLLKSIEERTNIPRFRLGSLNPLEISDEMLEFLKNSEKFCPHFHLSLQSMCDKTLKSMNRHYSVQQALDLIEKIHETFSHIYPFVGSDIIAGFAGESEEDFAITVENLKKSKLTQIHTFPYSVRKNTAAEKFENQLDSKTKGRRAKIIKEISAQKHSEFLDKNLNTVQEVLVEKNLDRKTGFFKGVSRNYINVLIEPKADFESIKRTLQKVKITQIKGQILGEII
ncbi:MAG: tRNA (N(6)-L-threonylcarbamoyladenosine(37)-C(2))-methylthiotransferase MtaB [Candidatus Gastranaerophilaceae bacterium]